MIRCIKNLNLNIYFYLNSFLFHFKLIIIIKKFIYSCFFNFLFSLLHLILCIFKLLITINNTLYNIPINLIKINDDMCFLLINN